MTENTGIPYELLTQTIFEQIVNQNTVNTIKIDQNVILQGKTLSHQIDVYWEFETGGIKYTTVVQAKDWETPVNQGELLKFKGVLDDLPGQPRGVFVTRTGYQSGARDFAKQHGIILYEMREPSEKDPEEGIRWIVLNTHSFFPNYSDVRFNHDKNWAIKERERLQTPQDDMTKISIFNRIDEILFTNENGAPVTSLKDIIHNFYPQGFQELPPTKMTHTFTDPTFVPTGVPAFPRLKVNSVDTIVSVVKVVQELRVDLWDVVGVILKNVLEGTHHTFDKNLKLRK